MDYKWLDNDFVEKMELKFRSMLEDVEQDEMSIWDPTITDENTSEKRTFQEFLYLTYMFVTGNSLYTSYTHAEPICEEHQEPIPHLVWMAQHGLYSHNGQSTTETDHSYLDFVVMIHDSVVDEFILTLRCLYKQHNVNVYARTAKDSSTYIKTLAFITKDDFAIEADDFEYHSNIIPMSALKLYNDFNTFGCMIHIDGSNKFDRNIVSDAVACHNSATHTKFYCQTWSFNGKNVEEPIIDVWRTFNNKYGKMCNV